MYYTFNPHKNLRSVGDFFLILQVRKQGLKKVMLPKITMFVVKLEFKFVSPTARPMLLATIYCNSYLRSMIMEL